MSKGKYVDIKVGYSCNNNCIHCVIADQRKRVLDVKGCQDRTTKQYKKELYDSIKRGFDSVIVTGGEPTIRGDLFELLNYAMGLGYEIQMQTNGRMFSNDKFAKKFSKFSVIYTIALHGSNSKIHDSITQVPGSFNQTVQGIINLKKLYQLVTGKVVISRLNYKDLNNLLRLYKEFGVVSVNFAFPHALGNAKENFDLVVPRYKELQPYVHKLVRLSKKLNIRAEFEAIPYCFMKDIEDYVCETRYNKKEMELKQFGLDTQNWTLIRPTNKQKFPQCKKCRYDNICEGPWKEYPERFGNEEFKAVR